MFNVLVLLACLGAGLAAPAPADQRVFAWEKHDRLNCWWDGHGADELAGNVPGAPLKNSTDETEIRTLGQCQAECVQRVDDKTKEKTECHAVLFQVATGMCYGKKNVDVSKCAKDETVTLYMRPKATEWLGVDPALLPATTTPKPTTTTTTTTPAAPLGVVHAGSMELNSVPAYTCKEYTGPVKNVVVVAGDPVDLVATDRYDRSSNEPKDPTKDYPWGDYGRAAYVFFETGKDTCSTEIQKPESSTAFNSDFEVIHTSVEKFKVDVFGQGAKPVGEHPALGAKYWRRNDYYLTVTKDGEGGYSAKDCVLYYNIKNTETEPVQGITDNWRLVTPTKFISDEIKCNA